MGGWDILTCALWRSIPLLASVSKQKKNCISFIYQPCIQYLSLEISKLCIFRGTVFPSFWLLTSAEMCFYIGWCWLSIVTWWAADQDCSNCYAKSAGQAVNGYIQYVWIKLQFSKCVLYSTAASFLPPAHTKLIPAGTKQTPHQAKDHPTATIHAYGAVTTATGTQLKLPVPVYFHTTDVLPSLILSFSLTNRLMSIPSNFQSTKLFILFTIAGCQQLELQSTSEHQNPLNVFIFLFSRRFFGGVFGSHTQRSSLCLEEDVCQQRPRLKHLQKRDNDYGESSSFVRACRRCFSFTQVPGAEGELGFIMRLFFVPLPILWLCCHSCGVFGGCLRSVSFHNTHWCLFSSCCRCFNLMNATIKG